MRAVLTSFFHLSLSPTAGGRRRLLLAAIIAVISAQALSAQTASAPEDEEEDDLGMPVITTPDTQTEKNRTFALVELGTILGGGLIWYNLDHSNQKDQLYDTKGALANRFNGFTELGVGIGLRVPHYRHVLERRPVVDWYGLEIAKLNTAKSSQVPSGDSLPWPVLQQGFFA